jgi:hypothetical protein
MEREISHPARRRFTHRFYIGVLLLVLINALTIWGLAYFHPNLHTSGEACLIASLLALAAVVFIVSHGHYLVTAKDEFQRTVHIQAMLSSVGATFTVTTFWGLLEAFTQAPHLNILWICPMFVCFTGVSKLLVTLRYK